MSHKPLGPEDMAFDPFTANVDLRERSVADMLDLLEDASQDIAARTRRSAAIVGAFLPEGRPKQNAAADNLYSRLEKILRNLEDSSQHLHQFEEMMEGVG